MKFQYKLLLWVLIVFLNMSVFDAFSQGCSDAGFCTVNNFKPSSEISTTTSYNVARGGISLGRADNNISVFGAYLEYNGKMSEKVGVDVKLTSILQTGNELTVAGLSDIYISGKYHPFKNLSTILGLKLPLSMSNRLYNNSPLPMDYQSSLGTFDVLAGVGYEIFNVQLMVGIQQPLSQNNNLFESRGYTPDEPFSKFQSTNRYKRKGDLLARLSYPVVLTPQLTMTPGLLPIYHLGNDSYTTTEYYVPLEIEGSKGLTLNANVYFDYLLNENQGVQLSVGAPLITREVRPEGLTRSFIVSMEYWIKF